MNPLQSTSWSDDRFEYLELTLDRSMSRSQVRQALVERAEYGKWELARSAVYVGGRRKVVMRRRTVHVKLTWTPRDGALDGDD